MPPDPRACAHGFADAALAETVTSVVVHLVVAHRHGDIPAVADQLGRLLKAVAAYSTAIDERPGDAALRRAVTQL